MPDPYDYTSTFANVPAPGDSFMAGMKNGVAITELQTARAQQVRDLAAQAQKKAVVQALVSNPNATADDYAKATVLVPELHAQFKQAWDTKSTAQQQSQLSQAVQWSAAIQSGQPKIASDGMRAQADAIENTANAPTPESKALRAKADQVDANPDAANFILKSMISAHPNGKTAIDGIVALGKEGRDQTLAPGALRKANADAGTAEADLTAKNLGIVAQQAGALAKPGIKPAQAITMFKSLEARGIIPKGGAQDYIDGIPADPKALPDYLKQIQDSGVGAKDQKTFTTPDANTVANNVTSRANTAANNATQLAVQDRIDARSKAESEGSDDAASFSPDAIDNAAARYNIDGTLPPMGMGKAAAAGRTKILNRAAELKAGISGEQQRRDQLGNKGEIASQTKAVKEFASGKLGSSVRSFNVGLSHLDTLGQLADAMGNKDTQAVNRLGNYFATQTGAEAPVKFEAAKKVVTDEIVKAIVGAGGTGHDREEAAKTVSGASSPAQLRGVINTYKELMVGQLGGLDQQYRTSTGRDDFHKYLSPQALTLYGKHGGTSTPAPAAAPALPAGWSVKEH